MRRTVLHGGVALGGLVGAGYLALRDDTQETYVKEMTIWNRDPTTYTVHMLLLEDGEPVHWESTEAGGAPKDGDGSTLGGGEFETLPSDPGADVLYVWRDDQPRSAWAEYDLRAYELSCVKFMVMIGGRNGGSPGDVSLISSAGCPYEDGDDS